MMRFSVVFISLFLFCFTFKQDAGFFEKLVQKAINETKQSVKYDPAYVQIKYPNGDVPLNTGFAPT